MGRFEEFNKKLALKTTKAVGSMACAYIFAAIALISLPAAILSGSVLIIVSWIAQTFLQLVLLSIILVGQNVQSEESEKHLQTMLEHISNENEKILQELKSCQQGHSERYAG